MSAIIRTVLGDIAPPDGFVLAHEHLQLDLSRTKSAETVLAPSDIDDIIDDLMEARRNQGLALMAELTPPGAGRDVVALRRISEKSGVHVVASTGLYWEPLHPDAIHGTVDSMRRAMVREIEHGVGSTGVRCGVIKIGTDAGDPPEPVARIFAAAARAARDTGVAIITHTTTPDQARWQIDRLEVDGADLSRVLISHLHKFPTIESIIPHARRGVRFGFDQIGFAKGRTLDDYADLAMASVQAGLADQTILSSDVARRARLRRHGGDSYETVFKCLLPMLRSRGADDATIERLMRSTPLALFSLAR